MGVIGTWCQICGIPVQQDHYVQLEGMLGIYRGGEGSQACAPALPFGPDHAWLKDAVALRLGPAQTPVVLEGRIHDGFVETPDGKAVVDGMVWTGLEDRAALHRVCWILAGRPESWQDLKQVRMPPVLAVYQEQLFEFAGLVQDGRGWMLIDPRSDSEDGRKNRERILALLQG